jgi:CRISPR system Cascade subunit CasD
MSAHNTVFLRLDGPLQSWGVTSRFVVRETADVPSKSGVLGLICAAMGLRREAANGELEKLAALRMGVRIDRPGTKITDYHTAGAKLGMMSAAGVIKKTGTTGEIETHVMRKEYLCDAAFLVALQGDASTVGKIVAKLQDPVWPPFLGRKSCPPSAPVFARVGTFESPEEALRDAHWQPRLDAVDFPQRTRLESVNLWAVLEATPTSGRPVSDVPVSFTHRVYGTRWVRDVLLEGVLVKQAEFTEPPRRDGRPATSYPKWDERKQVRLCHDRGLCVFCKQPARDVHHVTYQRVGYEPPEDLRSVCRLCHDAMTLLEYAAAMAGDRIDPCDPKNRDLILAQRTNILTHRDQPRRKWALRTEEDD